MGDTLSGITLPGDATKFLDGLGAFSVPAGGASTWNALTGKPLYDVVGDYNGSGSSTTTTGSVSSSSTSLVVASASTFSVGQGIFITGAGAAGANKVTTISAISGTTITLASAASTTVAGVVVQHDDTAAINSAIAAACAAHGGVVFLSRVNGGRFRCNGPFNGTTNSILTFPQDMTYNGQPPRVELRGEIKGCLSVDGQSILGGCVLDFAQAPTGSGTSPAAIAVAPYVDITALNYTTSFNNVDVAIDDLFIVAPANSTFYGVQLGNALRADIGDNVSIFTLATSAGAWAANTHGAQGLVMPQWLNNVFCRVGNIQIGGWDVCLVVAEHTRLLNPYLGFARFGMAIVNGDVTVNGVVEIEQCNYLLYCDAGVTSAPVRLLINCEPAASGTYTRAASDIYDTGNKLSGIIEYCMALGGGVYGTAVKNGAANVTLVKLS